MRAPSGYLTRNYIYVNTLPCGFTMKISSRGYRYLIYIVKRNTKTDGIGPYKPFLQYRLSLLMSHVTAEYC